MEKFTYQQGTIYRRKSFTAFQRAILSSIWVVITAAMVGGILLQQQGAIPAGTIILLLIVFTPLLLGGGLMTYIALNPQGPEQDFVLPTVEIDPNDISVVKGTIALTPGRTLEVEVTVPNVYGSSLNLLEDSGSLPGQGDIATEEMIEFALEEIRKKYPKSCWEGTPEICGR